MQLLEHRCSISRNQTTGTNGRRALQLLYSSVACLGLPMSARAAIQNGFDIGRAYDFYFDPGADVKVGDKLGFNGDTYVVSGRQLFEVPVAGHLHITAQQEIS